MSEPDPVREALSYLNARLVLLTLCALCGLRLALSFRGIDYGLPELHEPDVELVRQSLHFRGEAPARAEQLATYPHLLSRLMSLWPRPSRLEPVEAASTLEAHLRFAARHFHAARATVALLAAAALPLTYLLARRFLSPPLALLAVALLATSLLHFDYSQQARPHGPFASFLLLALLAAGKLARHGRTRDYLAAGLAAGLALGSLHTGALALLAGLLAHLAAARGRGARGQLALLLPIACVLGASRAFYPFLWQGAGLASGTAIADESPLFPHRVSAFDGSGFARLWSFLWYYDPLLWGLALAALALFLWRRQRAREPWRGERRLELCVHASALLPYLLLCGIYSRVYVRFLEPLVPYAAVCAAWFLGEVGTRIPAGRAWRAAGAVALALLLAAPATLIVRLTAIRSAPSSTRRCADWIRAELEPESERVLLTPTLSLPLLHPVERSESYDPWSSPASHFWYRYLWELPVEALQLPLHDLRYLARGGAPYMDEKDYPTTLAKASAYLDELDGDYAVVTRGGLLLDRVNEAVRRRGELVLRISPWRDGGIEVPVGLNARGDRFWQKVLRARCTGPLLEVYRLRAE